MTQLGEAAFAAAVKDLDGKCPFCNDASDDQPHLTLNVVNDSEELGGNLPEPPDKAIQLPEIPPRSAKPQMSEDYELDDDTIDVAMNAHHVIPGNASFAQVADLHRWLAWTVKVEKHWYMKLKRRQKAKGSRRVVNSASSQSLVRTVVQRTAHGAIMKDTKTTSGQKVYGKADYDINGKANGIWLPSNNALENWSGMSPDFQKTYARRAMKKHKVQFHDAHPTYSNSVKAELQAIDKKVSDAFEACQQHKSKHSNQYRPALKRLAVALDNLSVSIRDKKLKGRAGKAFEEEWKTSRFSAGFKCIKADR